MTAVFRGAAAVAAAALVVALAGCAPEPGASVTPSASESAASPPSSTSSDAPSTAVPSASGFALPAVCESVYSAGMLATLQAQVPPLNDPGVTLFSTQNAAALEVLDSGIATLRCSWGRPSESGLATNVSVIDAEQAATVQSALEADGIACEQVLGGTRCVIEQQRIDLDDNLVTTGEQHFFRDGGWVSTAYVGALPDGYTQDIAETLWG